MRSVSGLSTPDASLAAAAAATEPQGDRYLPPNALPVAPAGSASPAGRQQHLQYHKLEFAVDGAALRRRRFAGGTFRFKSEGDKSDKSKKSAEGGGGGGRQPGQRQSAPEQQEEEGAVWGESPPPPLIPDRSRCRSDGSLRTLHTSIHIMMLCRSAGALRSHDEQHSAFRRSQEEAAADADAAAAAAAAAAEAEGKRVKSSGAPPSFPGGSSGAGGRKGGVLRSLRQRWEVHQREAAQVKALAQRLRQGARWVGGWVGGVSPWRDADGLAGGAWASTLCCAAMHLAQRTLANGCCNGVAAGVAFPQGRGG